MEKRKFQEPWVYVSALIIGTLLFILIFSIFFQINTYRNSIIIEESVDKTNKIFEIGFLSKIGEEDICSEEFSEEFNRAFYSHVKKIGDLEEALGKEDWRVLTQKKIYTLAQMQHYLITKEQIKKCGLNKTILFFFYTNKEKEIRESEVMGELISSIVFEKGIEIQVYSLDADLDIKIIKGLINKFGIKHTPSVFIEGKEPFSPKSIDELKSYIGN